MSTKRSRLEWYSFGLAILALVVSLFLHFEGQRKRIPTFVAEDSEERNVLLANNADADAPFRITTRDGEEIRSNVTAATAYFWNQGNRPIKQEHILSPVKVFFPDTSVRILDLQLTQITRDVTEFSASLDSSSRRSVELNFAILEEGDGASIDLIYTGSPQDSIAVSGVIEGSDITHRQYFNPILRIIISILIIVTGFFLAWISAEPTPRPPNEKGVIEVGEIEGVMLIGKFLFVFIISIVISVSFYLNGVQGFIPDTLK